MGTRADFYIKKTTGKMEWLGSIAWDGYVQGIATGLLKSCTANEFKEELEIFASSRTDFTAPKDGWPWPWENSKTTDYSYIFDVKTKRVLFTNYRSAALPCVLYLEQYALLEKERALLEKLKKSKKHAAIELQERVVKHAELFEERMLELSGKHIDFPTMSTSSFAPIGSARSGLIVIGSQYAK